MIAYDTPPISEDEIYDDNNQHILESPDALPVVFNNNETPSSNSNIFNEAGYPPAPEPTQSSILTSYSSPMLPRMRGTAATTAQSIPDTSSTIDTTSDDMGDFHAVQLETLEQENQAKQQALEEVTNKMRKLHDKSVNYENNIRERDLLIATLSKELKDTQSKIVKIKHNLKERGLNSQFGSELDTQSQDGRRSVNSTRNSSQSPFSPRNANPASDQEYQELQKRLVAAETKLHEQTDFLEKITGELGLSGAVDQSQLFDAIQTVVNCSRENLDPSFSSPFTLLDHTVRPDHKKDSIAINGIDEDWLNERSDSNASSAIIQLRKTTFRTMATNTSPLSASPIPTRKNSHPIENSSDELPESPRLHEEILLLESEVAESKQALYDLKLTAQEEKNQMNFRINTLEEQIANKEKVTTDQKEEIENLLAEAIEHEHNLQELHLNTEANTELQSENEALKSKLQSLEELKNDLESVSADLEFAKTETEALKSTLANQEAIILELETPEQNTIDNENITFNEKIASLQHALIIAKKCEVIRKEKEQLEFEHLQQIEYVGELERQLEYYRLGTSPVPENPKSRQPPSKTDDLTTQKLLAQDQQIENLTQRLEQSKNENSLAVDRIATIERDNEQFRHENQQLFSRNQQLQAAENRLQKSEQQQQKTKFQSIEAQKDQNVLLAAKDLEINDLQRKLDEVSNRLDLKNAEFTAAVSPLISPRAQTDNYEPAFNGSAYLNQSVTTELENALEEKNTLIEVLRVAKTTLESQRDDLTAKNQQLSRDLIQMRTQQPNATGDPSVSQYRAKIADLEHQLSTGHINAQSFNNSSFYDNALRDKNDQISQVTAQLKNTQDQLRTLSSKIQEQERVIQEQTRSLQDKDFKIRMNSSNENSLREKEQLIRDQDQKLRQSQDKVRQQDHEIQQQAEKLRAKDQKIRENEESLRTKDQKIREIKSNQDTQANFESELYQSENETIKTQLQNLTSEHDLLKTKLSNLDARLQSQISRNMELEEEIKENENEKQRLTEEAFAAVEDEREKVAEEIEQLKSYIETLEQERQACEEAENTVDFATLKLQIEDLTNKTSLKDEEVNVLSLKCETLEQRLMESTQFITARDREIGLLKFELDEKVTEIMALESPRNDLVKQLEREEIERTRLEKRVNEVVDENERLQATMSCRARSYDMQLKSLQEENSELGVRVKDAENVSSLARRLTSLDVSQSANQSMNGSILIDGEVPEKLAELLREVHKEGVNVLNNSEKSPRNKIEETKADDGNVLKHLERLQDVLMSRDSNETMIALFKDFEKNVSSDRENMLKEIKGFVEKVQSTEDNHPNHLHTQTQEEVLNRLNSLAENINENLHTPRRPPMMTSHTQITPDRFSREPSSSEITLLQTKNQHLQQRLEALQLAKPDEVVVLESFRQRIVVSVGSLIVLLTMSAGDVQVQVEKIRHDLQEVFDQIQSYSITNLLPTTNPPSSTNATTIPMQSYLQKCNRELVEKTSQMSNHCQKISNDLLEHETILKQYRSKCHDFKTKAKQNIIQAKQLYAKLSRSEVHKRQLVYQKAYFLMKLETETDKIKAALNIVNDLILDLPESMRQRYAPHLKNLHYGLDSNNNKYKLPLSRYSSRASGLNHTSTRARRNWRVIITAVRAAFRLKILRRRSVRIKLKAERQFSLALFEDGEDAELDSLDVMDLKLDLRQHVSVPVSPARSGLSVTAFTPNFNDFNSLASPTARRLFDERGTGMFTTTTTAAAPATTLTTTRTVPNLNIPNAYLEGVFNQAQQYTQQQPPSTTIQPNNPFQHPPANTFPNSYSTHNF